MKNRWKHIFIPVLAMALCLSLAACGNSDDVAGDDWRTTGVVVGSGTIAHDGESVDVLVTKPSELAFYPVPKLFIKRVGKHEMWGAIHSAEIGDGTLECRDIPHTLQMIDLFLKEDGLLFDMCDNIVKNKSIGIYDGAYKVVELAMGLKK